MARTTANSGAANSGGGAEQAADYGLRVAPDPQRYTREGRVMELRDVGRGGIQAVPVKELINQAHRAGLISLELTPLLLDGAPGGYAVFKATARFLDGTVFEDVGDAFEGNCNRMVAKHHIRMAATRAIGRVLRLALNVAENAAEEFAGDEVNAPAGGDFRPAPARSGGARVTPLRSAAPAPAQRQVNGAPPPFNNAAGDGWECEVCGAPFTDTAKSTAAAKAAYSARTKDGHIVCYNCRDYDFSKAGAAPAGDAGNAADLPF
jgi:hypothetical protein